MKLPFWLLFLMACPWPAVIAPDHRTVTDPPPIAPAAGGAIQQASLPILP
jgi:hypothetical protein